MPMSQSKRERTVIGTVTYYAYTVVWCFACLFGFLGPVRLEYRILLLALLGVLTPNRLDWFDRRRDKA